jgi:hypothetical protein
MMPKSSLPKDLVNFRGELEIQIANAANIVSTEVYDNFVPDVAPFWVMIHRLRYQSHTSHVSKRGDKIPAFKSAAQLAIYQAPAFSAAELAFDFSFREFFCTHLNFSSAQPDY